ncbi:hypothetical protein [Oceanobacillus timonensis]|nr:hypothetical protein [Oceanobacillus timonensis]
MQNTDEDRIQTIKNTERKDITPYYWLVKGSFIENRLIYGCIGLKRKPVP